MKRNKNIQLLKLLKQKIAPIAVASTMITSVAGCDNKDNENQEMVVQNTTMHFDVGEHIISIPIKEDIRNDNVQYDYHDGYEPVGISITVHGGWGDVFGGGAIIYSNISEVDCSSNIKDENGNYLFLDFGAPTYTNESEYSSNDSIKEFDIGEHIISIPIKEDVRNDNVQYDYYDGYEVIGMTLSSMGAYADIFSGGVLLYKNITPVKCLREDNGYTKFGIPIEKVKVNTLN